jgi:hypothetical protein
LRTREGGVVEGSWRRKGTYNLHRDNQKWPSCCLSGLSFVLPRF